MVANLEGANFHKANLEGAYHLSLDQLSKVKTLHNTKLDKELFKPLKEKFPTLFEAPQLGFARVKNFKNFND
jgi:uncharacterized protein YjbI with pentapeptide repeats